MPLTITLPDGYGYPVIVALGLIPVLSFAHGSVVMTMRDRAKIPYPNFYASAQQCKESQDCNNFNCAQRAHGNFLENMSQTMAYILFAGLSNPKLAAALGAAWAVLRTAYMVGYVFSGKKDGQGRYLGMPFWFAQGGLWFLCLKSAYGML